MLSRRGFGTLAGAAIATGALAACSGNSTGTAPPGSEPSRAGASSAGSTAPAGKGGTLEILTPEFAGTRGEQAFEESMLGPFKRTANFDVGVDYTGWGQLPEKLASAVAGGMLADLVMMGVGWVEPFAARGVLSEIDESLLEGIPLNENLLATGRYDGKLYGVPYLVDGRFLTYHKDMFEAAGIREIPDNLEDFREMLKEVVPAGGVAIDLFGGNIRQTWVHLVSCYGGRLFSADGMNVAFDDGTGLAALEFMLGLVADGTANPEVRPAEGQPRPYQQRIAAMELLNSSVWNLFKEESPDLIAEEALGMTNVPRSGGGDPVMFMGGTLLTVSARTEHRDPVNELISALMDPEAQMAAFEESAKPPAREDVSNDVLSENRLAKYTVDNYQYATSFEGGTPAWMEIRNQLGPEIEAAVMKQKSPQEAIDEMARISREAISLI